MLGVTCKSSQATTTNFYIFHFNFLFMQNLQTVFYRILHVLYVEVEANQSSYTDSCNRQISPMSPCENHCCYEFVGFWEDFTVYAERGYMLILLQTTELFLLNVVDTRVACYTLYFVQGIHCAVNYLFFVHYKSLTCMLK